MINRRTVLGGLCRLPLLGTAALLVATTAMAQQGPPGGPPPPPDRSTPVQSG
jgi:hypothetical protein